MAGMVDLGSWGDSAMKAFVQFSPSPAWANKIVAPYKGLPFHDYLRAAPPRRERTLTGPVDPTQPSLLQRLQIFALEPQQRFYPQEQSAFLAKLPLDVRRIIYDMVLGGSVLHLDAPDRRSKIVHHVCTRPETINNPKHECIELRPTSPQEQHPKEVTGLLCLLLTCRRIYSEAVETLYGANTFEFTQNFAAFRFLKLMIPPQRLHSIRHFRMRMRVPHHPCLNSRSALDWSDLFTFFATEMKALQSLILALDPSLPVITQITHAEDDREGVEWIRPMVLMALEANRKRACKVLIVTEGAVHDLNRIFHDTVRRYLTAGSEEILVLTCVLVHERIRLSLLGTG